MYGWFIYIKLRTCCLCSQQHNAGHSTVKSLPFFASITGRTRTKWKPRQAWRYWQSCASSQALQHTCCNEFQMTNLPFFLTYLLTFLFFQRVKREDGVLQVYQYVLLSTNNRLSLNYKVWITC